MPVYCNTVLTTLNARKELRGESQDDEISLGQGTQRMTNHSKLGTSSRVGFLGDGVGTSSRKRLPNNISIKVNTTHEFVRDEVSCV